MCSASFTSSSFHLLALPITEALPTTLGSGGSMQVQWGKTSPVPSLQTSMCSSICTSLPCLSVHLPTATRIVMQLIIYPSPQILISPPPPPHTHTPDILTTSSLSTFLTFVCISRSPEEGPKHADQNTDCFNS